MRRIRLYVDMPLAGGDDLALPQAAAHRVVHVLRMSEGQPLVLFNGNGRDYPGHIVSGAGKSVRVRLDGCHEPGNESPWPLVLVQCLARGSKMDLVVQKATELGATGIVPVLSERSEVRLDAARAGKRREHWQAVAASACEQCARARIPLVGPPRPLAQWLDEAATGTPLRLALTPGTNRRVRELTIPPAGVVIVVGPEGGLGERDRSALAAAGFSGLSLGRRILRTETAGLAALAAIQACHADE